MKQERLPTQSVSAERRAAHLTLLVKTTTTVQMVKSALTVFVCPSVEVSPVVPTEIVQKSASVLRAVAGTRRVFTTVMATPTILMQMENASRVSLK
jgi:hypothetical protein